MNTSITAAAIDTAAHDLRNTVALVVSGCQLLDGAEAGDIAAIAGDVAGAGYRLGWFIDHAIETARLEQGRVPNIVDEQLGELLASGVRRAQRAGCAPHVDLAGTDVDLRVRVDAGIAERLIADVLLVLHERGATEAALEVAKRDGACIVRARGGDDRDLTRLAAGACMLAMHMARATQASMEVAHNEITLRFALA
jgi:hypothetical protein